MAAYGLSDGVSVVSLNPEYDFKQDGRKVENNHRTRGGALYKYTWGVFSRAKFSVEFLTSADMCMVNSWWGANTPLVLYDATSAAVISGYLVNPSRPIDQFIQPYNDEYKGVIELESF